MPSFSATSNLPAATSTAISVATSAATSSVSPGDESSSVVYRIDIFLLIVILISAIFTAPRAIARFARRSDRSQGFLLRSVTLRRRPRINLNTHSIYLHSDPLKAAVDLDGETTEQAHLPYFPSLSSHIEKALPPRPLTIVESVPSQQNWHMPMLSSLVPRIAYVLQYRVHEAYSLGQVLLLAAYFSVLLYAGLYKSSPFWDFERNGWVCVSQLPFVYILATKNNVIGMLIGVGYEKLLYLHRFAGWMVVVVANVHALGFFYKWSIAGNFLQSISQPDIQCGLVALICADILGLLSMQFVRSRFYSFFVATHVIGSIVILCSLCYHMDGCVPYVIVACVFYGVDHIVRAVKTRITTATLRPIPELGLTRVEIPSINVGWRVGQHVRLRVLSTAMGLLRMTEVHPFTITSVNKTDEGLVLLCKKAGRWTTRMYEIASTSAYGNQGQELGKSVRVMVEGPYGGVGNTVISSYSGAMFVAGGSGVTFVLSAVQDLVRSGYTSDVTDVDIVWIIADAASLTPMIPLFTALMSQCTAARMRFSVFYTHPSTKSLDGMYLPPGITLTPGRPNLAKHLDVVVNSVLYGGGCSGVFVGVCGPVSLSKSVSETVRRFDLDLKRSVGGIELHQELF